MFQVSFQRFACDGIACHLKAGGKGAFLVR
ncbi:hypothetical protein M233_02080 [Xylella fastidiosa subsp. multiplex Griffin-1]|nr:hypothetical protein M233_02080 [Xylella fastidiosa subsp. multiplex Griffin-1]